MRLPVTQGLDRYFGLAGRTVLLTGATRGIGLAMTEAFVEAGAKLVIASNEEDECLRLGEELRARGVEALAVPTDVRSAEELRRLADSAVQRFGAIDVLVCNAGVSGPVGPMAEVDDVVYAQTFDVNLRHAFILCGRIAPLMAKRGEGSIIVTSSIAGLRGNARIGLYAMTKAALAQLARNLAVEYGSCGVRANAIAPGLIRTSWASAVLNNPQASEARLRQTPLRRIGEPWEVAAAALFLAGPGSGFVTGQTLVVDGGTVISDGN
jgi:NAD(P)-dependent dehydrogenase (short-subunit alcohol dehydrogenase family)